MKRKLHTPEQIVKKLRQADAVVASASPKAQLNTRQRTWITL